MPHPGYMPLPRDVLREELAQFPQTLRLRTRAQQRIQKIQIRQALCQLKAELWVVQVRLGRGRLHDARFQQFLVLRQSRMLRLERCGRVRVIVVEELHFPAQIVFLFVDHDHFEAPSPTSEDVHFPVRVALQHLLHDYRAAGIHDAIVLGQHDAELGVLLYGLANHFLVTVLENMQRQVRAREDYYVQGEQREQPRGHATIIASQAGSGNTEPVQGAPRERAGVMRIDGKVVLITGASEGIGAACAVAFRKRGARLSLMARSPEKLRAAGGPDALVTPGDLTVPEIRQAAVDATLDRFGAIDILINNAGMGLYDPAWSAPLADARRLFELNFFAPLALTQLVAPHMRARASGVIVNVSSVAGRVTLPWLTLYSASKYALCSLTDGLRMELKKDGIHTITVCPNYVKTKFQDHALGGQPPPGIARRKQFAITPEQCAEAIARGVERGARTVMAPRSGWLFVLAERLFPSLVDAQLAAILHDV
jgi:short-subunit dehydrogenase